MSNTNIPYLTSDQPTPETALSTSLTEQQQGLLDKFKERLPELINADTSVHDDKAFCDDPCLLRYLRATKWNLDNAFNRLLATLKWRRNFQPHKITMMDMKEEGVTGKIQINGFDLNNHPILYMFPSKENTSNSEKHMQYLVFSLELAIKCMPKGVEKFCIVTDLRNLSTKNLTPISESKMTNEIFSQHYPERIHKFFLVEAPWIFSGFYKIISPLLDPATREKINFVNLKDINNENTPNGCIKLSNYISMKYLYEDFGGENPYQFEPEPYFNHLQTILDQSSIQN